MRRVHDLEVKAHGGHLVGTTGRRRGGQDVDLMVGQHAGDVVQQSRPVECLEDHRDHKMASHLAAPVDVNESVALFGHQ